MLKRGEGRTLDYAPCRYGVSRLMVRGPRRALDAPYVTFVGGTEFYGRFVPRPVSDLVEDALGITCVNLAAPNAGVDAFAADAGLLSVAAGGKLTVLQVMGAQNLSNRFYSVHPRRNDRVVKVSDLMHSVFPELEFLDVHFTGHMMESLARVSPDRFHVVLREIRAAWAARMSRLIDRIDGPVLLLWLSDHAPGEDDKGPFGPLYIDRPMLESLRPQTVGIVECIVSDSARAGTDGMVFDASEAAAAALLPGPGAHAEAARALIAEVAKACGIPHEARPVAVTA